MRPGHGPFSFATGESMARNDPGIFVTWKKRYTIFPVTCSVTGKRIPWFTKAMLKCTDVESRGEVITHPAWVSMEGYTYLKLKGDDNT